MNEDTDENATKVTHIDLEVNSLTHMKMISMASLQRFLALMIQIVMKMMTSVKND